VDAQTLLLGFALKRLRNSSTIRRELFSHIGDEPMCLKFERASESRAWSVNFNVQACGGGWDREGHRGDKQRKED
jgi:hypothetical protein